MKKEIAYTNQVETDHIKAFGQFFTMPEVADFMCAWVCKGAESILDPAVGNSVFLRAARKISPASSLKGYEIDPTILNYFGNPAGADISNSDYLQSDWDEKYDAIVCNPPYNRFQAVPNRNEIIASLKAHTGIEYSSYTNLYILFLLKSIFQMSEKARLAYIIPTEFLNPRYGTAIKNNLLEDRLLYAIINFKNDSEMFFNATTTCCILLLDRTPKDKILFYSPDSVRELSDLTPGVTDHKCLTVDYSAIKAEDKWRMYLNSEESGEYKNLVDMSKFCSISRGIATGANDFFCMSPSRIRELGLPDEVLTACICRSADVKNPFFTTEDFNSLIKKDKNVFILDIKEDPSDKVKDYIREGELNSINKKYLLSCRHPWYKMERKPVAPIWVSSACRDGLKFVRNLAGVNSLTTFHSVYINPPYEKDTDVIFCYFLTPIAQSILRENRKELGNGLEKFQPSDLKTAKMLDITLLSQSHYERICRIYRNLQEAFDSSLIVELNEIFLSYLKA